MVQGAEQRITPTPVGNAIGAVIGSLGSTDHPHACGERVILSIILTVIYGSPPRLWGTRPGVSVWTG